MADRNVGYPFIALYLLFWMCVAAGLVIFITSNNPPTAPVLGFENEEPTTLRNINVAIETESIDRDGHSVKYLYAWTKDGQAMPEFTEKSVKSAHTTKGEVWEVTVTPDDGTMGGSLCALPWRECAGQTHVSASVTVANSVPKVKLSWEHENLADEAEDNGEDPPPPPTRREPLTIAPEGLDSDDDEVYFRYFWYRAEEEPEIEEDEEGNEIWPEPEFSEATLPANTAKRDEEWVVVVWPSDCVPPPEGEDGEPVEAPEAEEDGEVPDCHEGNPVRKRYMFVE